MKYEKFLKEDPDLNLRFDSEKWFDENGTYKCGLRESPKKNEKEKYYHLSYILKQIFPEYAFVHNKYIKINDQYVYDHFDSKIRPDFICEELKLVVEFDGESWQGGGHYTDPGVCIKDIDKTIIMEALGYKVVRIPFYIQLDPIMIEHYFNVKVTKSLYDMDFDHGFLYPTIKTPAYFCDLGIKRFLKELENLPENVFKRIMWTIGYRLIYESERLNDWQNKFYDSISNIYKFPEYLKSIPSDFQITKHIPINVVEGIQRIFIEKQYEDGGNSESFDNLILMDIQTKFIEKYKEIETETGRKWVLKQQ